MLVTGFPADAFGTNCYVVATAPGEQCLIVDPGIGVLDQLGEVLEQYRLRPAAVMVTHGHLDHTFSVTPVCGAHGVAVTVHPEDRYRLADPMTSLGAELRGMLERQFGPQKWQEPDDVRTIEHGESLKVAGIDVGVIHAPGHTEGSAMFTLPGVPEGVPEGLSSTLLSGDVLFAGAIGRTDLPGGDPEAMVRSLRDRVLPLPDDVLVLPGHGPATTIGRERAGNPYRRDAARS